MTPQKYDLTKTYTTRQVADIFKCTEATIQRKAREGELPVVIICRKLLFPQEAIQEHLREHLMNVRGVSHND